MSLRGRHDFVYCMRHGCRRKTRNKAGVCSETCAAMVHQARADTATLPHEERPLESLTPHEVDDVDAHRRIWCRRQAACLDFAERNGWRGFSCSMCPVRDELSVEERKIVSRRMRVELDDVYEVRREQ